MGCGTAFLPQGRQASRCSPSEATCALGSPLKLPRTLGCCRDQDLGGLVGPAAPKGPWRSGLGQPVSVAPLSLALRTLVAVATCPRPGREVTGPRGLWGCRAPSRQTSRVGWGRRLVSEGAPAAPARSLDLPWGRALHGATWPLPTAGLLSSGPALPGPAATSPHVVPPAGLSLR